MARSADEPQEGIEAFPGAAPAHPQRILAEASARIAEDEHRHDGVVDRSEDRDELRDQVDRAHEPRDEDDERDPDTTRRAPVDNEIAAETDDVGQQPDEVTRA